MSTTEDRLASLEARMDQMGELRTLIVELRQDMHGRFDQVDRRFGQVDGRLDRLDSRLDRLDDKVDRHFTWIVGIQMTFFITVIALLVREYYR